MRYWERRLASKFLWLVSAAYAFWAWRLIEKSSLVAVDGKPYFCLFDDAMIAMRYAWNLAHGKGCCWNVGQYVQGYTSPLMVGVMALPCAVFSKSTACHAVQLLGIPTVLAVAWYTRRIFLLLTARRGLSLGVFVAVLAYYPLSYWSLMGMEVGLVVLLMLVALGYALRHAVARCAVFLCLAFLARPDFVVLAAVLLVFLFLTHRQRALLAAGAFAAFVALVLACQYLYYGDALPNTYTLKAVGVPAGDRIRDGLGFVRPFFVWTLPLLGLAAVGLWPSHRRRRLLLAALAGAVLAYQISVGGDPWPLWRMLVPMIPLALLLAASGARFLLRGSSLAATVAVGLALVLCDLPFAAEILLKAKPYKSDETILNVNTALVLNQTLPPGSSIGVEWAGALPYYTDFRAIDFLGKTDRNIARMKPDTTGKVAFSGMRSVPGHNKYNLDYSIVELQPDYIQRCDWGHSNVCPWASEHYTVIWVEGIDLAIRNELLP